MKVKELKIKFTLYSGADAGGFSYRIIRCFLNTKRGNRIYTQEFKKIFHPTSDKYYFWKLCEMIKEIDNQIKDGCLWDFDNKEIKRVLTKNIWVSATHPTALFIRVFS